MSDDAPTLRSVAWREVFPWLLLLRCFRLSISVPLLTLATIAVLLVPVGWRLAGMLFIEEPLREVSYQQHGWPWPAIGSSAEYELPHDAASLVTGARQKADGVFRRLLHGWQYVLYLPQRLTTMAFLTMGGLWTLAVWGLLGGAITRIAVAHLGRDEHVSIGAALRHTARKYLSYVGAPLLPLVGILLGIAGLALLGLIMRWDGGVLIAGLLWPLVLIGGLILAILLLGLCFGWPLMWVSLGAEPDGDSFEAVSRGYTYTLQRPLRLAGYLILATLLGVAGWLLVYHVSEILLAFPRNTIQWSAGIERAVELSPWLGGADVPAEANERSPGVMQSIGGWLILLGNGLVRSIATGYGYSFFFCAAAAIYLLMRREIDEAEFDDVFGDDEELPQPLPPLPPVSSEPAAASARRSGGAIEPAATAGSAPASANDEPDSVEPAEPADQPPAPGTAEGG